MDLKQGEDKPDLDIGSIFTVGIVGAVSVIVAVVLLQAYFYKAQDTQFAEAYAEPTLELKKVQAEQQALLSQELVPEPGKGTIHITIDRAIEIVAREGAHPEAVAPPAAVPGGTAPAIGGSAPGAAPGPSAQGTAPANAPHKAPGKSAHKP